MSEKILRGNAARQVLESALFIEAWEGLEAGAVERLAACDTSDTKTLQTLTMGLQTLRAVRRRFEVWMVDGEQAAKDLIRGEERAAQPGLLQRFRRTA